MLVRLEDQETLRMIFSSSTEYAIRGLSELAGHGPEGPIMLDDLVKGTDLAAGFPGQSVSEVGTRGHFAERERARGRVCPGSAGA